MGLFWFHQIQQLCDEVIHPHGLLQGHFMEVPSEFFVIIPKWEELKECPDRRQRILEFVGQPRCKVSEEGELFRPAQQRLRASEFGHLLLQVAVKGCILNSNGDLGRKHLQGLPGLLWDLLAIDSIRGNDSDDLGPGDQRDNKDRHGFSMC